MKPCHHKFLTSISLNLFLLFFYCNSLLSSLQLLSKQCGDILCIFQFNSSGYVGCYKDHENRTFTKEIQGIGNMTITKCQTECRKTGYKYAGMQVSIFFLLYLNIWKGNFRCIKCYNI